MKITQKTILVMCRRASDELMPGSRRGYQCRRCKIEVQASPDGQRQIAAGGIALCNDCAWPLLEKAKVPPFLNPAVVGQLAREAAIPASVLNTANSAKTAEQPPPFEITYRTEFLPESRKTQVVETQRRVAPHPAGTMTCDCCLRDADRHWVYSHRGFCVWPRNRNRKTLEIMAGEWAMCVYCNALYVRRDIEALVARVTTLNPDIPAIMARGIYTLMPEFFTGEMKEWPGGKV